MADLMIYFLICNIFISGIIGFLLTVKQIFKSNLSSLIVQFPSARCRNDYERFRYFDTASCIGCGLCARTCAAL